MNLIFIRPFARLQCEQTYFRVSREAYRSFDSHPRSQHQVFRVLNGIWKIIHDIFMISIIIYLIINLLTDQECPRNYQIWFKNWNDVKDKALECWLSSIERERERERELYYLQPLNLDYLINLVNYPWNSNPRKTTDTGSSSMT